MAVAIECSFKGGIRISAYTQGLPTLSCHVEVGVQQVVDFIEALFAVNGVCVARGLAPVAGNIGQFGAGVDDYHSCFSFKPIIELRHCL